MDPTASATQPTNHVLKEGDTFLIANSFGDIEGGGDGLFHNDTRLLSTYRLRFGAEKPALLGAMVTRDNVFFIAHLTNQALPPLGDTAAPKALVHIARTRFLAGDRLYEQISCVNYGNRTVTAPLWIEASADFRDMFEVRGTSRAVRGELLPLIEREHGIVFRYRGLDGLVRHSEVMCSRAVARPAPGLLEIPLHLPPGGSDEIYIEVGSAHEALPSRQRFRTAAAGAQRRMRARQRGSARVKSAGPLFNHWMEQSRVDLALLTSELDTGPYPYAGIPWYSTPFGRDAVITALQTLWLDPQLARGVLRFLAKHQAQEESAFLDAAPGKIMHETRKGEMALLRELPFGLYYGGVDTTPLFVMLAHAYAERTGDSALIDELWPALLAAVGWIERVCDGDRHGLLVYQRGAVGGLVNQGWKDSEDSVFHADGRYPAGPIALVEVQGYAFAALRGMASLARQRGEDATAQRWLARAETLRAAVEQRFWMRESRFYGLAIDGDGELCQVRASNPGHLLYVGLPTPERAAQVTAQLLSPAFNTGWGLRTLAEHEAHYNPMSYHNGSVWPHDTALCVAGIARYGDRGSAVRILRSVFETAVHFDMRLPELFCGFARATGSAPVAYPVACLPQAWAAGSAFMLLQACLGVSIDGASRQIEVNAPRLPPGIDEVSLRGIVIGEAQLDLVFKRYGDRVGVFAEGRGASAVSVRLTCGSRNTNSV